MIFLGSFFSRVDSIFIYMISQKVYLVTHVYGMLLASACGEQCVKTTCNGDATGVDSSFSPFTDGIRLCALFALFLCSGVEYLDIWWR